MLCKGAQASIIPEPSAGWAKLHRLPREGSQSLLSLLARSQWISHTHVVLLKVFIVTYLSFREAKPRVRESGCLNTQGSEAELKVQLQRRVGKNHVWSNWQSRVRLKMVRLHNICNFLETAPHQKSKTFWHLECHELKNEAHKDDESAFSEEKDHVTWCPPTWKICPLLFRWFEELGPICELLEKASEIGVSETKSPTGCVFQKYVYTCFIVKIRIDSGSIGFF